MKLLKDPI